MSNDIACLKGAGVAGVWGGLRRRRFCARVSTKGRRRRKTGRWSGQSCYGPCVVF